MTKLALLSAMASMTVTLSIGRPQHKSAELSHVDEEGTTVDEQTESIEVVHGAFGTCVTVAAGDTLVVAVKKEGSDDPCFVGHIDFPAAGTHCFDASACFASGSPPNTVGVLFTPPGNQATTFAGVLKF